MPASGSSGMSVSWAWRMSEADLFQRCFHRCCLSHFTRSDDSCHTDLASLDLCSLLVFHPGLLVVLLSTRFCSRWPQGSILYGLYIIPWEWSPLRFVLKVLFLLTAPGQSGDALAHTHTPDSVSLGLKLLKLLGTLSRLSSPWFPGIQLSTVC